MSLSRRKKFYQIKAKYRSTVVARPYPFFLLFCCFISFNVIYWQHWRRNTTSTLRPKKPLAPRDCISIFVQCRQHKWQRTGATMPFPQLSNIRPLCTCFLVLLPTAAHPCFCVEKRFLSSNIQCAAQCAARLLVFFLRYIYLTQKATSATMFFAFIFEEKIVFTVARDFLSFCIIILII